MAITKLTLGQTYDATHDAAIIDAIEHTGTGHDHDGTDSKGSISPTSITCSGVTTLNGACTLGDGDDNITLNPGTGTFSSTISNSIGHFFSSSGTGSGNQTIKIENADGSNDQILLGVYQHSIGSTRLLKTD